jgi:ribonuclease P protein component
VAADSKTPRYFFSKKNRLTLSSEFASVRQSAPALRGSFLMLGVLTTDGAEWRAGFVTSKRVGNAVLRNRVRRRLREIVRQEQARLRRGIWLVVIARPAAARASFRELKDEWLRLAERASILAP